MNITAVPSLTNAQPEIPTSTPPTSEVVVPLRRDVLQGLRTSLGVAERKVVLFRDQDFKDLTPERQIEIARHFGPIQRHPTSGNVKGYPEFHVGEEFLCRSTEHALTN